MLPGVFPEAVGVGAWSGVHLVSSLAMSLLSVAQWSMPVLSP